MYKKLNKNTKGFTLIEVIIAIALVSLVILISSNILMLTMNSHKLTEKEYSLQSELRRASEKTNEIVRYSKAVFAVPNNFVSSVSSMDTGWDYLMASPDGKRIVIMKYDEVSNQHIETVVVNESENVRYELVFEKDTTATSDTFLKYKIYAYSTDDEGNRVGEKIIYETTVETVNAIQIVDKGTESSPSIALAFRSDGQTSGKGKNQIAYVTIVIDTSNSMNQTPSGGGSNTSETTSSRIYRVRNALVGDGTNTGKGIIQMFSKEENVFISLVPFANTANYPSPHANTNPSGQHPFYEVYKSTDANTLITTVKDLKADGYKTIYGGGQGGTNTGDGLRRAYFLHDSFRARMSANGTPISDDDQVHHYMILLVDGETTFETALSKYTDSGFYTNTDTNVLIGSNYYRRFNWQTNWNVSKISDYELDGNIPLSVIPVDEPLTRVNYGSGKVNYKARDYWGYWYNLSYNGRYALYGDKNNDFNSTQITGNGSSTISNSSYIRTIGNLIQGFEDSAGIRSYLIGYASGLNTNISYIGNQIGTDTTHRYVYNSADFNLEEIFKNIATDIMADFWIAAGPQIRK